MVLFADGGGLFFNEWYWDPIFRAIAALPFLGIVAFGLALVSRRWIPKLGHRVWVAVAIIVGGEALILGAGLYSEYQRPIRESRVVARTLDFTRTSRARSRRGSSSPAPEPAPAAGRCLLPEAGCRRVRTPEGMPVLIARSRWGLDASAVLGRTLVSVLTVDVGEAAVLAYYDALAPVAPDDIEFTGA
jgi:hypothetical protein